MTTKITLDSFSLNELAKIKEGECFEAYDDNGVLGFFTKDSTGDIKIYGRTYTFNYFAPTVVKVYEWINNNYVQKKPITK